MFAVGFITSIPTYPWKRSANLLRQGLQGAVVPRRCQEEPHVQILGPGWRKLRAKYGTGAEDEGGERWLLVYGSLKILDLIEPRELEL